MKTVFTRTIPQDTVLELAQHIIENMCASVKAALSYCDSDLCPQSPETPKTLCNEHNLDACPFSRTHLVRQNLNQGRLLHLPSSCSVPTYLTFSRPNIVHVNEYAAGCIHTLRLNVATGRLIVMHDGDRLSIPHNLIPLLPKSLWQPLCDVQTWNLLVYRTSSYGPAFAGLLKGFKVVDTKTPK